MRVTGHDLILVPLPCVTCASTEEHALRQRAHEDQLSRCCARQTMMSQAQQSNEPAQMRETLEQAQQSLAAMKDHMGPCMNMMSMMEQMQGGMGGQMKKK